MRKTSSTAQPRHGRGLTATSMWTAALASGEWATRPIIHQSRRLCARPQQGGGGGFALVVFWSPQAEFRFAALASARSGPLGPLYIRAGGRKQAPPATANRTATSMRTSALATAERAARPIGAGCAAALAVQMLSKFVLLPSSGNNGNSISGGAVEAERVEFA
jgi:hypothetical protein